MRRAGGRAGRRALGAMVAAAAVVVPLVHSGAATPASPLVLTASPTGSGTDCSAPDPCTLATAQQVVRAHNQDMAADIDVELLGGTYDLTRPLAFGPQDSGSGGHEVIYRAAPGADPVLSGGFAVTGWQDIDPARHIWAAPIAPGFDTGQLYVDGVSVPRSLGLPSAVYVQTKTGFLTSSPVLAGWRDVRNVSAVFTGGNGAWTQPSCPIASVSGDVITMAQPCWANLHLPGDGSQEVSWVYGPQGGFGGLSGAAMPSFFENAYELLTPGHWSIDTTQHEIYYMAQPSQDPAQSTILAPVLTSLVAVEGTLDDPVHDLALDGLQFSYATWNQPDTPEGFAEMQADWTLTGAGAANGQGTCQYSVPPGSCPYASWTRTPGAVTLSATHDVTLEGDSFEHLGGAGLDIEYGSRSDVVEGNVFTDIAASAIQLGSTDDPLPVDVGAGADEIDSGDVVTDNYIHDVADQYLGGIGIWIGYVSGAVITHNQIDDVPYTAISIGWGGWHSSAVDPDADPNVNSDNLIADNLLYDYMQKLGDGGAIYTNGAQATGWNDELVIRGNVAYAGTNTDFSLYTDTGSKYVDLSGNVVYDQPVDSFATGGCHTVGHIRIDGNWFSQAGPLYPCDVSVDIEDGANTLVCTDLPPDEAPIGVLQTAGLEPAWRFLVSQGSPSVAVVGPSQLPLGGGALLIGGTGFSPTTTVSVGGSPARSVQVLSPDYLVATAPPGHGSEAVTVTTPGGTSPSAAAATVRYSSTPTPCLPLVGGNLSTALAP